MKSRTKRKKDFLDVKNKDISAKKRKKEGTAKFTIAVPFKMSFFHSKKNLWPLADRYEYGLYILQAAQN